MSGIMEQKNKICDYCGAEVQPEQLRRDWEKRCWYCELCEEDYVSEQLDEIEFDKIFIERHTCDMCGKEIPTDTERCDECFDEWGEGWADRNY